MTGRKISVIYDAMELSHESYFAFQIHLGVRLLFLCVLQRHLQIDTISLCTLKHTLKH